MLADKRTGSLSVAADRSKEYAHPYLTAFSCDLLIEASWSNVPSFGSIRNKSNKESWRGVKTL
jgi:hypothetical protein